jgi:hypothetical protein
MVRIPKRRVTLIKAKAGLPPKEYDAHWSGPHAAIAKDLPGLIWYVQNHVVRPLTEPQGRFGELNGIAEVAFDDPDKVRGTVTGWSRVGELRDDERAFLGDKFTFVTHLPPDIPDLCQRRIVAMLERPADGSPAPSEESLSHAAEAISAVSPCHLQMVAHEPDTPAAELEAQPHALLFVEMATGADAKLLDPDGPVLRHVESLGLPASVYLMAAEAKRLPIDLPL